MKEETKQADIIQTMCVLDRGRFIIECGRELQELTGAIVDTNKAGELTIKLKVTPSGWNKATGKPNQFDFQPEVVIKKPRTDAGKTIFFVTEDNTLTRDDPDQMDMFESKEETKNARR